MSYCIIARDHPLHGPYHDREYGFPMEDDNALFERLMLEIKAFAGFDIARVARFTARDRQRLMRNEGIIRNAKKIDAAVENAKRILALGQPFASWLAAHHPRSKEEWVKLFKKTFVFTGGEITGSFLISIGYLPGAHDENCAVYRRISRLEPKWASPRAAAR